ncbi:non-ribosomal peptide synthetase [Cytobacillus purgationiresistens]|uniref:Amino acid adenylation domain-containing protein n=1 Tax=Cytobacillus purgationiresistens TaxID=863449 RepID=A0ABU0ANW9_9BACI|nr:amino acid adenylation domain-containing protein [Cytobacillus purgationiresistens]MDQ0272984.1 amino acid adenylation domain-containing protein [Cytobacillus purgationiresistens]
MKSLSERINALTPEQRVLFESQLNEKKLNSKLESTLKSKRIPSRNHTIPSPLSIDQERLWFFNRMHPEVSAYNVYGVAKFKGKLNHKALEHSINTIIQRHEAWRTVFDVREPLQVVLPELKIEIPTVDVSNLNPPKQEEEIQRLVKEEVQRLFNLEKGPLVRFKLFYQSKTEAMLVMTVHHIVMDHLSFSIFFEEMVASYKAFLDDTTAHLPDLPVQYADYTEWQREYLQGETKENLLSFWRDQLKGSDYVLDITTDFPRTPAVTYSGARSFIDISKEDLDSLKEIAKKENATPFMIFLTAFKVLLHRYTGQSDIIVGSPLANRNRLELEKVIGYFLTMGAFRSDISGDMSFRELLKNVRETSIGVYKNQDLPIGLLLDEIKVPVDPSRNPLFQAVFVYVEEHEDKLKLPEVEIEFQLIDGMTAKYDITIGFTESKKGLEGFFEYSPDLFREETIKNMKEHFCRLLKEIIKNPDMKISDMKMLSDEEQKQQLLNWNKTEKQRSFDQLLHLLVEKQAAKTPETIAIKYGHTTLTYRELNERSNQLAHLLINSGVKKQVKVGMVMDTSLEMVIGMLGIFKAGCVYVPVESSFPEDRIQYILDDSGVEVLVTQSKSDVGNAVNAQRKIYLDHTLSAIKDESNSNIQTDISAYDLAYIMYTSGSTGKPKGVALEHSGICNLIEHSVSLLGLAESSRMLQLSSINFDTSIAEMFSALSSGATLCIAPIEARAGGMDLIQYITEEKVTTMMLTPTIISSISPDQLPDSVNTMGTGAEPCTLEIRDWKTENRRVLNIYGPTETSIYVLANDFEYDDKPSCIGRPVQNTKVYILDSRQQLVPTGVRGELYVGGAGVARGYINNQQQTKEKFIKNPFRDGEYMYRTGDFAKWLPDGKVEILGRKDDQVKIKGVRIETGEIETVLSHYPDIEEAVVMSRSNSINSQFLCAYYQATKEVDEETLRAFLMKQLPTYMIPSHYVRIDKLPIGDSGKLDKKALPEPDIVSKDRRNYISPVSESEKIMVLVWEEVLGIKNIGLEDSFFNLGGDSLKAIQVSSSLYKHGWEFEMKQIFLNPVLKDLCFYLKPITDEDEEQRIGTFLTQKGKPIVFCFPPVTGFGVAYYQLARNLGNYTIYSFDYLKDTHKIKLYAQKIIEVQPEGPYVLMGYSAGGKIAFEVAKELEQVHRRVVADMIMIEAYRVKRTDAMTEESIEDNLKILMENPTREYLKGALFSDRDKDRIRDFMRYVFSLEGSGEIEANIHLIHSPDYERNEHYEYEEWFLSTNGEISHVEGYGLHNTMLFTENADKNGIVVENILSTKVFPFTKNFT